MASLLGSEQPTPQGIWPQVRIILDIIRAGWTFRKTDGFWKQPGLPTEVLRLVSVDVLSPITRLLAQRPFHHKIDL